MSFETIAIAVTFVLVTVVLLFMITRRALRLFVRLVFICLVVLAMIVGVAVWWYAIRDARPLPRQDVRAPVTRRAMNR
jgi:uncharacterized membrane protein